MPWPPTPDEDVVPTFGSALPLSGVPLADMDEFLNTYRKGKLDVDSEFVLAHENSAEL